MNEQSFWVGSTVHTSFGPADGVDAAAMLRDYKVVYTFGAFPTYNPMHRTFHDDAVLAETGWSTCFDK